jgi:hypothetical protein
MEYQFAEYTHPVKAHSYSLKQTARFTIAK